MTNLFRLNKPCSKKRVCACAWENHSGLHFLCAGEREMFRRDETKQFPDGFSSIKLRWVLNCIYQVLFRLNRVQLSVISTKKRKTWAFNYPQSSNVTLTLFAKRIARFSELSRFILEDTVHFTYITLYIFRLIVNSRLYWCLFSKIA